MSSAVGKLLKDARLTGLRFQDTGCDCRFWDVFSATYIFIELIRLTQTFPAFHILFKLCLWNARRSSSTGLSFSQLVLSAWLIGTPAAVTGHASQCRAKAGNSLM